MELSVSEVGVNLILWRTQSDGSLVPGHIRQKQAQFITHGL